MENTVSLSYGFHSVLAWLAALGALGLLWLSGAKVGLPVARSLLRGTVDPALGTPRPNYPALVVALLLLNAPLILVVLFFWTRVDRIEVAPDGSWLFRNPYGACRERVAPDVAGTVEVACAVRVTSAAPADPMVTPGRSGVARIWIELADGRRFAFESLESAEVGADGGCLAALLGCAGPPLTPGVPAGPHGGRLFSRPSPARERP